MFVHPIAGIQRVGMTIDETRQNNPAAGIDHLPRLALCADRRDSAVFYSHRCSRRLLCAFNHRVQSGIL